jgi:copper(I)-binding protein
MNRRHYFWLALPLAAIAAAAVAAGLKVESAWARATPPGSSVAAVYLVIDNQGPQADRLLKLKSPIAASAEVHRSSVEGGMTRMRPVSVLHIAQGERVEFAPGGLHVMLMELRKPLVAGQSFELELQFEVAGPRRVMVVVRDVH